MEFRRSGVRAERLRRILRDDSETTTDDRADAASRRTDRGADKSDGSAPANYSDAVMTSAQPRLTDVVPQRGWVLALLLSLSLCGAIGIPWACGQVQIRAAELPADLVAPFQLQGTGTLVRFFASAQLLIAAVGCWMIYLVRRHKLTDYRGDYAWWNWTSALLVVAGIDCATDLHLAVQSLVAAAAPAAWAAQTPWWMLGYLAAAGVLATKLVVEVTNSRMATLLLLVATACYATLGSMVSGVIDELPIQQWWLAPEIALAIVSSTAHAALACSIWTYARHVRLDAEGRLRRRRENRPAEEDTPRRQSRSTSRSSTRRSLPTTSARASKEAAEEEEPESKRATSAKRQKRKTRATDAAPSESSSARRKSAKAAAAAPEPESPESDDDGDTAHLSRAERRRLRKLKRRGKAA